MSAPQVSPDLPSPPTVADRGDPATFNTQASAFLEALPQFEADIEAIAAFVNNVSLNAANVNQTLIDVEAARDTTEQYRDTTVAARDTTEGYRDEVVDAIDDLLASGSGGTVNIEGLGGPQYTYDNRDAIRNLNALPDRAAFIEGLGLFQFVPGSAEPDDDETAFASNVATGVWLLKAPAWDVSYAYWAGEIDLLWQYLNGRILHGTADSTVTSVGATSAVSFDGTVAGAAVEDCAIATPPGQLGSGQLSHQARVSAPDTVTITISNPSASSDSLGGADGTWQITVIKEAT